MLTPTDNKLNGKESIDLVDGINMIVDGETVDQRHDREFKTREMLLSNNNSGTLNFFAFLIALFSGLKDDDGLSSDEAVSEMAVALSVDNSFLSTAIDEHKSDNLSTFEAARLTINNINHTHSALPADNSNGTSTYNTEEAIERAEAVVTKYAQNGNPIARSNAPWQSFLAHLIKREGYRQDVYLDSLGKPTVGIGHLVKPEDNLSVGDTISDERVLAMLETDAKSAYGAAIEQAKELGINDKEVVASLASVNFQLGINWRSKFPNTWEHMKQNNFEQAVENVESSLWNKQTPVRVDDFQVALTRMSNIRDNVVQELALNGNTLPNGDTQLSPAFNTNKSGMQGVQENDRAQPDPLVASFDGKGVDQIAAANNAEHIHNDTSNTPIAITSPT